MLKNMKNTAIINNKIINKKIGVYLNQFGHPGSVVQEDLLFTCAFPKSTEVNFRR